ncbi:MAG: hypothetical protein Q7U47_15700 [Paludibacter sp.]|nr:hypothetical protein [Paludibacter sp.]
MENIIQYNSGTNGLSGQHYLTDQNNELNIELFISQQKLYIDINNVISKLKEFGLSQILEYCIEEIYTETIKDHGIFYQKFIEEYIRQVIRPILLSLNLNQQYIHEKYYPFLNINDYNKANLKLFNLIELEVLRYFTFLNIDNFENRSQLIGWFKTNNQLKTCSICGNSFRTVNIPDWIYINVYPYKDCCFNCNIVEENSDEDILIHIQNFVKCCGFIPPSNYSFLNKEFTVRIGDNWKEIINIYSKVGHPWYINTKFGSWFKALYDAKVIETIVTSRGVRCLSLDGHLCNSLAEKQIDDWLFEHNILHEKEPMYPKHILYNISGKRRGDWKVKNIFIEYFGLIGDKQYEQKLMDKQMLACDLGISLIEIYPTDLRDLNIKLIHLTI